MEQLLGVELDGEDESSVFITCSVGGSVYCTEGLEEVVCYADPSMTSSRDANVKGELALTFTERLCRRKREDIFYLIVRGSLDTPGTRIEV